MKKNRGRNQIKPFPKMSFDLNHNLNGGNGEELNQMWKSNFFFILFRDNVENLSCQREMNVSFRY